MTSILDSELGIPFTFCQPQCLALGGTGATGPAGAAGIGGGVLDYADFYSTMPPNNAAAILPGGTVAFPTTQAIKAGSVITTNGSDTFTLGAVGVYRVTFLAGITEAAQLIIALNGVEQPITIAGRDRGTQQIFGVSLIQTLTPNTTLQIRNPAAQATNVTLTVNGGGTASANAVTAHLVILRLA